MLKYVDLALFFCGKCKKFGKCGRFYPSTGKPVVESDVACIDGFELEEDKKAE
jgi:hypothetical protein